MSNGSRYEQIRELLGIGLRKGAGGERGLQIRPAKTGAANRLCYTIISDNKPLSVVQEARVLRFILN